MFCVSMLMMGVTSYVEELPFVVKFTMILRILKQNMGFENPVTAKIQRSEETIKT